MEQEASPYEQPSATVSCELEGHACGRNAGEANPQCSLISDGFAFQMSPSSSDPFPCLAIELEQQARALEDDWLCPYETTPTSSVRGPSTEQTGVPETRGLWSEEVPVTISTRGYETGTSGASCSVSDNVSEIRPASRTDEVMSPPRSRTPTSAPSSPHLPHPAIPEARGGANPAIASTGTSFKLRTAAHAVANGVYWTDASNPPSGTVRGNSRDQERLDGESEAPDEENDAMASCGRALEKLGALTIPEKTPFEHVIGLDSAHAASLSRPSSPSGDDLPAKRRRSEEEYSHPLVSTPRQDFASIPMGPSPFLPLRRLRVGASRPTPVRVSPPVHPAPRTPAAMPPPAITERPPRRAASAAAAAATAAVVRRSRRVTAPRIAEGGTCSTSPSASLAEVLATVTENPSVSSHVNGEVAGEASTGSPPPSSCAASGIAASSSTPPPMASDPAPLVPLPLVVPPSGVAARRGAVTWNSTYAVDPRTGEHVTAVSPATFCSQCGATSTPVWRAGPFGHKTLCNACGVRWMKVAKKERKIATAVASGSIVAAAA